jgi:hypothetical protein
MRWQAAHESSISHRYFLKNQASIDGTLSYFHLAGVRNVWQLVKKVKQTKVTLVWHRQRYNVDHYVTLLSCGHRAVQRSVSLFTVWLNTVDLKGEE